ncbi:hypothetical protein D3C76_1604110 [compost metagenome]
MFLRLPRLTGLAEPRVLQLRKAVAGPRRLAQQFMTDAPVTGIAAVAAEHLPQPALGHYHALASRLFEQASGQVLDLRLFAQARVVQQP